MLHYAGNQDFLAVTYSVNLKVRSHKIFIYKHGVRNILCKYNAHILADIVIVKCYYHVLTAEYV